MSTRGRARRSCTTSFRGPRHRSCRERLALGRNGSSPRADAVWLARSAREPRRRARRASDGRNGDDARAGPARGGLSPRLVHGTRPGAGVSLVRRSPAHRSVPWSPICDRTRSGHRRARRARRRHRAALLSRPRRHARRLRPAALCDGGDDCPAVPARRGRDRGGGLDAARDQRARHRRRPLPDQPRSRPRLGAGCAEPARMIPLQVVAILLVGVGGLAVVSARDPLRQTLLLGLYGLTLVVLFVVFQAPDVALSELVVSSVAIPFILLTALAKMRGRRPK